LKTLHRAVLSSPMDTPESNDKGLLFSKDEGDFSRDLDSIVDEGFLERMSVEKLKFAHDRIREAAYSLFTDGSARKEAHLRIGRRIATLLVHPTEERKNSIQDRLLLQTASQLNLGSELLPPGEEKRKLAELNRRAADLAVARSAFYPAVHFLEKGVDLLGSDPWTENFALMMQLSAALARSYYCTGRLAESLAVSEEVLERAKTFSDKRECYHTKIFCLMQQGRLSEALEVVLSVLAGLGITFPRRFLKFHIIKEILQTQRVVRRLTDEDLLGLRPDTNIFADDQSEFLKRLAEIASSSGFHDYFALFLVQSVRRTIQKGTNINTSLDLASWGTFLASRGCFDEAIRFGEIGIAYAEKLWTRQDSRAVIVHNANIRHWRQPYHETIGPLSNAIQSLWDVGDLETIVLMAPIYFLNYFCCGLTLEALQRDTRRYMELVNDLRQHQHANMFAPFIQMIANITTEPDNVTELTGEYMNEHELIENCQKTGNSIGLNSVWLCKMVLAYMFHDYELAAKMAKRVRELSVEGPNITIPLRRFVKGMTAFALVQTKGSFIHRRRGNAVVRLFDKWVKGGCINQHHMLLLLRAEQLSLTSKSVDQVRKAYDSAVAAAGRLGFQQNQALANERAGIYFLDKGDSSWARTYLSRARELYEAWGSRSKLKHLSAKYEALLISSSETTGIDARSSCLQAKTRLDDFTSKRLRELEFSQEFDVDVEEIA